MALNQRYVDADIGSDLNDGLTPATPWRTLGKSNTDAPSDCDIFCRGTFSLTSTLELNDGGAGLVDRHWIADAAGAKITGSATSMMLVRMAYTGVGNSIENFDIIQNASTGQVAALALQGGTKAIGCYCDSLGQGGLTFEDGGTTPARVERCVVISRTSSYEFNSVTGALNIRTTNAYNREVDHCLILNYAPLTGVGSASAIGVTMFGGTLATLTLTNSILASKGSGPNSSLIHVIYNTTWSPSTNFVSRYIGNNNCIWRGFGPTQNVLSLGAGIGLYDFRPTLGDFQALVAPDDSASIDADPLWVDEPNGDYRLRPGSPAATLDNTGGPAGPFGVLAASILRRRVSLLPLGVGL